jgi:hypothetical protein
VRTDKGGKEKDIQRIRHIKGLKERWKRTGEGYLDE